MNISSTRITIPPARRAFLFRSTDQLRTLPWAFLAMMAVTLFVLTLYDGSTLRHVQAAFSGSIGGAAGILICNFEARFEIDRVDDMHRVEQAVRQALAAQGYTRRTSEADLRIDAPDWLVWDTHRFRIEKHENRLSVAGPWLVASIVKRKALRAMRASGAVRGSSRC